MTDLDALLDAYASLPPEERAAVDALATAEPSRRAAHAEARRLAALTDLASAPTPGADLAQAAAARRLGAAPPEAARADLDRAADLGREAEAVEARLDQLEAEAEDPAARFERLTGRPLPDLSPQSGARPEAAPRRRWGWRWASALALLALGYGAAYAVSASRTTAREQVADLGALGAGPLPSADTLGRALAAVGGARRSTLGLFPRYDPGALDAAAAALADRARTAEPSSWPSQEARLALARVHLYRQRDVEAARVLGALVREGGYRAPAARRMLDFLRAQDAA